MSELSKQTAHVQRRPEPTDEIDLLELASILLAHWWKIVICTLLGAAVLLAVSNARYVPRYQATAKLFINNSRISIGITQVSVNSGDLSASQALVEIYSEFLNSHLVLDATGDALEEIGYSGYNYYNLVGRISTSARGNTPMLYLTAWDYNPEAAIAIVNKLAETLPSQASNIIEGSSVIAVDPAYNATLIPNSIQKNTLMGAAVGFALSAGLILLYYYFLNDMITQQDWLTNSYAEVPQLGCVPDTVITAHTGYGSYDGYDKETGKRKKIKRNEPAQFGEDLSFYGTEAYNAIRTNIKLSFHDKNTGHIIGITSATAGDGKSYTAVNLAYALAKDNARVLLIDGDMRKMTLNSYFQENPEIGLSEVLCKQGAIENAIQKELLHDNLSVLFSGSLAPNPSELLGSQSMQQLLTSLRGQYDYILIDLPPIGSVTDAAAISEYLDGMVLVVRHNHTYKKLIRSTVRQLEMTGVRLLGFVYNANVETGSFYSRYYSHYYYRSYYKKEKG